MTPKKEETKKEEEAKIVPEAYVPQEEMPSLIVFNEFLLQLQREAPIESVGSFMSWMKRKGIPKKLSSLRWREYFNEFINRKV
jgi:hypothetical protein